MIVGVNNRDLAVFRTDLGLSERLIPQFPKTVIAVSDVQGGIYNRNGLDLFALEKYVNEKKTVVGFPESEPVSNAELLLIPCDILVPAALERQITEANASKLQCRILAEAANGPTTPEADKIIGQRPEIFVIPDVLCNAGGVTVSYFEWVQDLQQFMWSEEQVNQNLSKLMLDAFGRVRTLAKSRNFSNRTAALTLGVQKVAREMTRRGLFP